MTTLFDTDSMQKRQTPKEDRARRQLTFALPANSEDEANYASEEEKKIATKARRPIEFNEYEEKDEQEDEERLIVKPKKNKKATKPKKVKPTTKLLDGSDDNMILKADIVATLQVPEREDGEDAMVGVTTNDAAATTTIYADDEHALFTCPVGCEFQSRTTAAMRVHYCLNGNGALTKKRHCHLDGRGVSLMPPTNWEEYGEEIRQCEYCNKVLKSPLATMSHIVNCQKAPVGVARPTAPSQVKRKFDAAFDEEGGINKPRPAKRARINRLARKRHSLKKEFSAQASRGSEDEDDGDDEGEDEEEEEEEEGEEKGETIVIDLATDEVEKKKKKKKEKKKKAVAPQKKKKRNAPSVIGVLAEQLPMFMDLAGPRQSELNKFYADASLCNRQKKIADQRLKQANTLREGSILLRDISENVADVGEHNVDPHIYNDLLMDTNAHTNDRKELEDNAKKWEAKLDSAVKDWRRARRAFNGDFEPLKTLLFNAQSQRAATVGDANPMQSLMNECVALCDAIHEYATNKPLPYASEDGAEEESSFVPNAVLQRARASGIVEEASSGMVNKFIADAKTTATAGMASFKHECGICRYVKDKFSVYTKCGHAFCNECILAMKKQCPTCNKESPSTELFFL